MLSITLAEQLKEAGLFWTPALHDFFILPERDLDEQLFVISDMMVDVEKLRNQHLITFNGAPEWAMDYVLVSEALWMPSGSLRVTSMRTSGSRVLPGGTPPRRTGVPASGSGEPARP